MNRSNFMSQLTREQILSNPSQFLNRRIRIANREHTAPLDVGDIGEIRFIRPVGERGELLGIYPIQSNNRRARPVTGQNNLWWVEAENVVLDGSSEARTIPKPRMTKKRIEAMKLREAALTYIQLWCTNLGFDFELLSVEKADQAIAIFHKEGKSAVNKMLFAHFNSLPLASNCPDQLLNQLDEVLTMKVDGATRRKVQAYRRDIESKQRNIRNRENNIANYEADIQRWRGDIANWNREIQSTETVINDLKAKESVNKPIDQYETFKKTVVYLKAKIKELCDTSNFYKLHSMYVPDDGALNKLEIVLETSHVFIRDNTPAPAFNMGKFLIKWKPFEFSGDDLDNFPDRGSANGLCYYVLVVPFKDNVVVQGFPHPHVQEGGRVCWGSLMATANTELYYNRNFEFTGDIKSVFIGLRELLRTYNSESPYVDLMQFKLKVNPKYYLTLEQVFKEHGRKTIRFNDQFEGYGSFKIDADTLAKINKVSIVRYLNRRGGSVSPELTADHFAIDVKTYRKYYVGTNFQHKDAKNKDFIKLADNTFVEFKAV